MGKKKRGFSIPSLVLPQAPFKSEGRDGCSPWGARSGLSGPVHTRKLLTASLVVSCPVRDSVWETPEGTPHLWLRLAPAAIRSGGWCLATGLKSRAQTLLPAIAWQGYLVVSQGFWMALCMYDLKLS